MFRGRDNIYSQLKIPVWLRSQKNIKLTASVAFVSASTAAADSLQKRPTDHFLSSSSACRSTPSTPLHLAPSPELSATAVCLFCLTRPLFIMRHRPHACASLSLVWAESRVLLPLPLCFYTFKRTNCGLRWLPLLSAIRQGHDGGAVNVSPSSRFIEMVEEHLQPGLSAAYASHWEPLRAEEQANVRCRSKDVRLVMFRDAWLVARFLGFITKL